MRPRFKTRSSSQRMKILFLFNTVTILLQADIPGHSPGRVHKKILDAAHNISWKSNVLRPRFQILRRSSSRRIKITEFLFSLQYCSVPTFQDPGSRALETLLQSSMRYATFLEINLKTAWEHFYSCYNTSRSGHTRIQDSENQKRSSVRHTSLIYWNKFKTFWGQDSRFDHLHDAWKYLFLLQFENFSKRTFLESRTQSGRFQEKILDVAHNIYWNKTSWGQDSRFRDSEEHRLDAVKISEFLFLLQYCSERSFEDPGSRAQETILDAVRNISRNKFSNNKKFKRLEAKIPKKKNFVTTRKNFYSCYNTSQSGRYRILDLESEKQSSMRRTTFLEIFRNKTFSNLSNWGQDSNFLKKSRLRTGVPCLSNQVFIIGLRRGG